MKTTKRRSTGSDERMTVFACVNDHGEDLSIVSNGSSFEVGVGAMGEAIVISVSRHQAKEMALSILREMESDEP